MFLSMLLNTVWEMTVRCTTRQTSRCWWLVWWMITSRSRTRWWSGVSLSRVWSIWAAFAFNCCLLGWTLRTTVRIWRGRWIGVTVAVLFFRWSHPSWRVVTDHIMPRSLYGVIQSLFKALYQFFFAFFKYYFYSF